MAQEHLAVTRDLESATVPFEELLVENVFEFADGLCYCWLADGKNLGRASDGVLPHHLDECAQVTETDAAVDHFQTYNL